jgi:hypothetical protein
MQFFNLDEFSSLSDLDTSFRPLITVNQNQKNFYDKLETPLDLRFLKPLIFGCSNTNNFYSNEENKFGKNDHSDNHNLHSLHSVGNNNNNNP